MTTVGSPLMWAGFIALVAALLAVDLGLFNRKDHVFGAKEALRWTGVWVTLALAFGAGLVHLYGWKVGLEFYTGWVIEYSLSVDNLFVFILIFRVFRIPPEHQHRVLFWGIVGALLLRVSMILAGAVLVSRFHWILYVFGAFLVYSGVKILLGVGQEDSEEEHPEKNPLVRALARIIPTTAQLRGREFFVTEEGRTLATPLLICLVTVEVSDVVFAVDSIPAIFAITTDPFVVFTSNIFAIMGLRSLYFLLARWVSLFRFLETGLGIVLTFVGVKMLVDYFDIHLHPAISLSVVVGVLALSVLLSVVIRPREPPAPAPPTEPPPPAA
ncbi:MAG: TerC family protein [Deltaproteobacteria bacterium]|nr:TerC family protein [Deltaproteobacteria bacterium]